MTNRRSLPWLGLVVGCQCELILTALVVVEVFVGTREDGHDFLDSELRQLIASRLNSGRRADIAADRRSTTESTCWLANNESTTGRMGLPSTTTNSN